MENKNNSNLILALGQGGGLFGKRLLKSLEDESQLIAINTSMTDLANLSDISNENKICIDFKSSAIRGEGVGGQRDLLNPRFNAGASAIYNSLFHKKTEDISEENGKVDRLRESLKEVARNNGYVFITASSSGGTGSGLVRSISKFLSNRTKREIGLTEEDYIGPEKSKNEWLDSNAFVVVTLLTVSTTQGAQKLQNTLGCCSDIVDSMVDATSNKSPIFFSFDHNKDDFTSSDNKLVKLVTSYLQRNDCKSQNIDKNDRRSLLSIGGFHSFVVVDSKNKSVIVEDSPFFIPDKNDTVIYRKKVKVSMFIPESVGITDGKQSVMDALHDRGLDIEDMKIGLISSHEDNEYSVGEDKIFVHIGNVDAKLFKTEMEKKINKILLGGGHKKNLTQEKIEKFNREQSQEELDEDNW